MSDIYVPDILYPPPEHRERLLERRAELAADLRVLDIEIDRLDPALGRDWPSRTNWLLRKLDPAMRHLRDAEDFARLKMPAWPTADRIREVHEKLTDDVLRGTTTRPTAREQMATFRAQVEAGQA